MFLHFNVNSTSMMIHPPIYGLHEYLLSIVSLLHVAVE